LRIRSWLVRRRLFVLLVGAAFFLSLTPFLYFHGWRTLSARIYRYDATMILSLRPGYRGLLRYDSCCMPRDDLRDDCRLCTVRIDDRRRREVAGNRPGAPEVVFLGDSNLFGQSLSQGETIADCLVRRAVRSGGALSVSNYAVPGNNSRLVRHQAEKILTDGALALVVAVGANDAKPVTPAVARAVDELHDRFDRDENRFSVLGCYALKVVKDRLRGLLVAESAMPLISVEACRDNLEYLADLTARRGMALIVMMTNGCWEAGEEGELNQLYLRAADPLLRRYPHVALIDRCAELQTAIRPARDHPYFTAERARLARSYRSEVLDRNSLYWVTTDFGHPNPIGAEVLADAIYRALHLLRPAACPPPLPAPWAP